MELQNFLSLPESQGWRTTKTGKTCRHYYSKVFLPYDIVPHVSCDPILWDGTWRGRSEAVAGLILSGLSVSPGAEILSAEVLVQLAEPLG